jgi:hypothetical protein
MSEDKFDWSDSGNYAEFPKGYNGPVYATPEWVRHPDRMPAGQLEGLLRIVKDLSK